MIKLFFCPKDRSIIGKKRGKFYNFPQCLEIEKPKVILPCQPFTDKEEFSNSTNHLNVEDSELKNGFFYIKKCKINIHYLNGNYCLSGNLPEYVLNGLIKLINYEAL